MKRIFWIFLLIPSSLSASVIDVCPTCETRTIREGIAKAAENDTIRVGPGNYPEGMLLIDKPLRLAGEGLPVVDGLRKEHVFYVRANNVAIEGFVIQNSGQSYISEYAGIRAEEASSCTFRNNVFSGNTYSIYLARVEGCLIEQNRITGDAKNEVSAGNGVHMWSSREIVVRGNTILRHRDGLYLEFTPNSVIEGNICSKNIRYGLHFMYSPKNRYVKNTFTENQTGVAVMYSKNVVMEENIFEKSWGRVSYGLLLKDISDSLIRGNRFAGNTVGIFADEVSRTRFEENRFQNNGWAVNILGNSEENAFVKNDFLENYFNAATNAMNPRNVFSGNYWSDYRGYDLNRDGTGDIPFRPMKIFSVWVNRYPELVALLASPVIEFLEAAEKVFPVLTPQSMEDASPRMKPAAGKP